MKTNIADAAIVELIEKAFEARKNAYIPYSGYAVGAALACADSRIFTGCNVENASFGATNCAERTAFFKAVSEGARDFRAIAIVGGVWQGQDEKPYSVKDYAYPCGICRQVMKELGGDDLTVIVARSREDYKVWTLAKLLPEGFGGWQ